MIKTSTISRRSLLKNEVAQRGNDIDVLAERLVVVSAEADLMRKELKKIKSHWLYRFINWFK